MPYPLVYEINTRCWLAELSQHYGRAITLANVPDEELAPWRRLGFTHIWLMGVWTSGPRAREKALASPGQRQLYAEALPGFQDKDVAGSPYAISEYSVPSALGGDAGLEAFRRKLNAQGILLLLDFVPNHVGLDHPWLTQKPDLFVQSTQNAADTFLQETQQGSRWLAHGKDPNCGAWTDTAQFDYRSQDTCDAMEAVLRSVARRCDGVRCDMAMLLLRDVFARTWKDFPKTQGTSAARSGQEFWSSAISSIRKEHPKFLFLAEVYWDLEQRMQELGFDYTYDKRLYDALTAQDAAGVQRRLQGRPAPVLAKDAHFIENHDELRAAAQLRPDQQRAAALVILGLPGMRLLHEGQLTGARIRTPVQLVRRAAESPEPATRELYERMLAVLQSTAVKEGAGRLLAPRPAWPENRTSENFVLVQWQAQPPQFDLVAVNLAPHRSQCYAPLSIGSLATHNWTMKDLLGSEQYVRWGDDLQTQGLYLDLPPHGAQLFHFEPA
jgi:glycosidase